MKTEEHSQAPGIKKKGSSLANAEQLDLPVPDVEPPVIVFDENDTEIEAGIKTFTAAIADNVGVKNVTLFYRSQTGTVFKTKPMQRSNKVPDLYTAELPVGSFESGALEYYIRADDVSGNSIFRGQKFYGATRGGVIKFLAYLSLVYQIVFKPVTML